MNKKVEKLKERIVEISHLTSIEGLLSWDQEVMMPRKAVDARAKSAAHLAGIIHKKFIDINFDALLSALKKQLDKGKLDDKETAIVLETWKEFEREIKLPESFVKELAEITSKAQSVWVQAREKNNFLMFLPYLSEIIKLKRKEAKLVGYKNHPYDALIDVYEPGATTEDISKILNDLKDFLVPFVKKINSLKQKINSKILEGNFPIEKQIKLNKFIAEKMGFDFATGRIDESVHPFTMGLHPYDTRLTTRYKKNNIFYSISSTIHEAGHGMYEQGLPIEYFGTPLSQSISLGVHESQSRLWENNIGKSKEFWKYFYPKLKKEFPLPFNKIPLDELYKVINKISPSLIRTEADEATYNLHIILRFEIEKEMIEGSIDLKDLPRIWNFKVKEYFGIEVPSDALGVLQDTHWSCGLIGYFPTYALGNLYAAQFYSVMERKIPDLRNKISKGDFHEIKNWLNKNIHTHGKFYSADGLVKKITGEPLNSDYFIKYTEGKYKEIYSMPNLKKHKISLE